MSGGDRYVFDKQFGRVMQVTDEPGSESDPHLPNAVSVREADAILKWCRKHLDYDAGEDLSTFVIRNLAFLKVLYEKVELLLAADETTNIRPEEMAYCFRELKRALEDAAKKADEVRGPREKVPA